MPTKMEGGALRRRRKLHATLNGKNRRIFRRLRPGFRSIIIFLTVCTHRRRPLLANREAARLIVTVWQAAKFLADWALRHHAGSQFICSARRTHSLGNRLKTGLAS